MNDLVHTYLEALPGAWLLDTGRYVVVAATMAGVLAVWAVRLAPRKLQSRRASGRDIRREILTSLRSALIFALLGSLVVVGARQGWMTVYVGFKRAGPLYLALSLVVMLVAHDAYFYWTHRAMHHRRLFALFHRTHHLSRTPTPWAAYAFSVPEAIVQGAFVPLFLLLVPMHASALVAFVAIQIVRNVMGHAGTEVHPRAFGPGRWLAWNNTTTYHDLHHELGRYNYGLYFRWWDKLMATEHPDYRSKFQAITSAPLSLDSPPAAERRGKP